MVSRRRRHKTEAQIYRERVKNLKKARAAKKIYHVDEMLGGALRHRVRAAHHLRRGGFLPGLSFLPKIHQSLQQYKPFTNAEKIANDIGVSGAISKGLDRLGIFGSALRGVHNFAKNTLGYGRPIRRRRRAGGRRRRVIKHY